MLTSDTNIIASAFAHVREKTMQGVDKFRILNVQTIEVATGA